jgi:hypothetical protein
LFYIDPDGVVNYRMQRDRYETAYATDLTGLESGYLEQLAFAANNRIYLWFTLYDSGTERYSLHYWHSNPYRFFASEDMAYGGDVLLSGEVILLFREASGQEEQLTYAGDYLIDGLLYPTMLLQDQTDEEINPTGSAPYGTEKLILDVDDITSLVTRVAMLSADGGEESLMYDGDTCVSGTVIRVIINAYAENENVMYAGDSLISGELI